MTQQTTPESVVDIQVLHGFMNALQRLIKIGVYYPSGHEILDKATARFLEILALLAQHKTAVTIRNTGTGLVVENITISERQPFVREFTELLSSLNIEVIAIDRQITREEVHRFIRQLLACRTTAGYAKQFARLEIAELPHSITLQLKEYLASSSSSSGDNFSADAMENLEALYQALAQHGLNQEQILQCRQIIDALPNNLATQEYDPNLPSASWDDVAQILARRLTGGSTGAKGGRAPSSSNANINALAAIFQKLEEGVSDPKAQRAINLLVSTIRRTGVAPGAGVVDLTESPCRRDFPADPAYTIAELQEFVTKTIFKPKLLQQISHKPADTETLSIVLQLARNPQSFDSQARMQRLFRELLAGELSPKDWEIVNNGLATLVRDGNEQNVATVVPMVLEPLRRNRPGATYALLSFAARDADRPTQHLLWPYIVNELLLVGNPASQLQYVELAASASKIPIDAMSSLLGRLETLEAFANNQVGGNLTNGLTSDCFPLFAFLLKTDLRRQVAERLIAGFVEHPPDSLLAAIAPTLEAESYKHQMFLNAYLLQAAEKRISPALKAVAGQIIVERLLEMPKERRTEPWVKETMAALGELASDQVYSFLQQVHSQRKMLLIPEWSATVRKAAEESLERYKRRK